MLIRNWMTKEPITATEETSLMRAAKLLKENEIGRLPVVDEQGTLVGIVSDRDVKAASPSKATTLEIHEMYYLLAELTVKDLMTKNVISIRPEETVERAALIMSEKGVGGLPVVDAGKKVVGIITDFDVFKVLVNITGVKHGGVQFGFMLPDVPGSLKGVLEDLKLLDARIVSILTSYEENGDRRVNIRLFPMERAAEDAVIEAVKSKHKLAFWARDNVHALEE